MKDGYLVVNGNKVCVFVERNLENLKWDVVGVEIVLDCIGIFIDFDNVFVYIKVGVKKVVIFVFLKIVFMFVMGVNYIDVKLIDIIVFNVLCIINCLVLLVKVIYDNLGIVEGLMMIVYVIIVM